MKDFYTQVQEWAPIEESPIGAPTTKDKEQAGVDAVTKKKEQISTEEIVSIDIKNFIKAFSKVVDKNDFLKQKIYAAQEDISKLSMPKRAKLFNDLMGI